MITCAYTPWVDQLLPVSLFAEHEDESVREELACHAKGYPVPSKEELDSEMHLWCTGQDPVESHENFDGSSSDVDPENTEIGEYDVETYYETEWDPITRPAAANAAAASTVVDSFQGYPVRREKPTRKATGPSSSLSKKSTLTKPASTCHIHPKNFLQELCQKNGLGMPRYISNMQKNGVYLTTIKIALPDGGGCLNFETSTFEDRKENERVAAQAAYFPVQASIEAMRDTRDSDESENSDDPEEPPRIIIIFCPTKKNSARPGDYDFRHLAEVEVVTNDCFEYQNVDRIRRVEKPGAFLRTLLFWALVNYDSVILVSPIRTHDNFLQLAQDLDPSIRSRFTRIRTTKTIEMLVR
jgi:hypothetical protein